MESEVSVETACAKAPRQAESCFFDERMEDPCKGPWTAGQSQLTQHSWSLTQTHLRPRVTKYLKTGSGSAENKHEAAAFFMFATEAL